MNTRAAITVLAPREEIERRWADPDFRSEELDDATVRFTDAPGDRGTEIHVELERNSRFGRLGEMAQELVGTEPRAQLKDELRRFKQLVETGVIARSEGSPEGQSAKRQFNQRPAQHPTEAETP